MSKKPTPRKKILLVEDDAAVREMLSLTLETAGYEVREAEHALAAIFALVRSGADLVITDIRMPVIDGFKLIRELKSHKDTSHVPVIAISGMDTPECEASAREAGCVSFLAKPIDPRDLLTEVAEALGQDR